ncbi:MAG: alpha/beta hydrolase [SAR324 cluster bacterium]|uniref:Alpha/beta hydrolase n=1 Tax=SAR324 cluster bacterium TaxID=2024889 RepID=A0A2A4SQQ0_9DELT|nr:MAG: alpha/beta hydrolase [SAR324 cluster bacterium]
MQGKEIQIELPYLKLAAKQWGNPAGMPVLAIHGWLDNAGTFDHIAPLLPDLNLVAIDLPGHGLSEHRPMGTNYHFIDYIEDVVAAADALGWQEFALIGHSLGGAVASLIAGTIPERILSAVFIDSLGPWSQDPCQAPHFLQRALRQRKNQSQRKSPTYPNLEQMVAMREQVGKIETKSVEAILRRGVRATEGGLTWTSDPRLTLSSPLYMSDDHARAFLENISAPCLVIEGEQGILLDNPRMRSRFGIIPQMQHQRLPGNHHLHLDTPEPVARSIRCFLENHKR